jgi:hypothetical protein
MPKVKRIELKPMENPLYKFPLQIISESTGIIMPVVDIILSYASDDDYRFKKKSNFKELLNSCQEYADNIFMYWLVKLHYDDLYDVLNNHQNNINLWMLNILKVLGIQIITHQKCPKILAYIAANADEANEIEFKDNTTVNNNTNINIIENIRVPYIWYESKKTYELETRCKKINEMWRDANNEPVGKYNCSYYHPKKRHYCNKWARYATDMGYRCPLHILLGVNLPNDGHSKYPLKSSLKKNKQIFYNNAFYYRKTYMHLALNIIHQVKLSVDGNNSYCNQRLDGDLSIVKEIIQHIIVFLKHYRMTNKISSLTYRNAVIAHISLFGYQLNTNINDYPKIKQYIIDAKYEDQNDVRYKYSRTFTPKISDEWILPNTM